MIVVDKTIISDDIFLEKFVCDLSQCLGTCCVDGDAGAPLEEEEVGVLEEIFHLIKPYMTPEGIEEVEKNGVFDYDGPWSWLLLSLIKESVLISATTAKMALHFVP